MQFHENGLYFTGVRNYALAKNNDITVYLNDDLEPVSYSYTHMALNVGTTVNIRVVANGYVLRVDAAEYAVTDEDPYWIARNFEHLFRSEVTEENIPFVAEEWPDHDFTAEAENALASNH